MGGITRDAVELYIKDANGNWISVASTADGNPIVTDKLFDDLPVIEENQSFTAGPDVIDFNDVLGRNAFFWEVINDGPGDFTVALSNNGTLFGDEALVKQQEIYRLPNISVDSLRITRVSDSKYRVRGI